MIIIDDILMSPIKGFMWICQEIKNAAEASLLDRAEAITHELSELYMMLETGQISETEFDERESELLDELDELQDIDAEHIDESDFDDEYDEDDSEVRGE